MCKRYARLSDKQPFKQFCRHLRAIPHNQFFKRRIFLCQRFIAKILARQPAFNAQILKNDNIRPPALQLLQYILIRRSFHPVVAVHKSEVFPSGQAHSRIASRRNAGIFLMHCDNSLIFCRVFVQQGAAAVRAAVIHADDFNIAQGLSAQAVKTFAEIRFNVVYRDDNRNCRLSGKMFCCVHL